MVYKKLTELKVHPKNEYYFDNSEEATFKLLKEDIKAYGTIRNPILITSNGIIISGHQRYRAFVELGKETIPCNVLDKKLTEDDLEYILIMENITSRNATKSRNKQKLGRCINKICEYLDLKNGNNQYTRNRIANNSLPPGITLFKSKQELADAYGISLRTLNNYQSLATNGIDELETAIDSGKISETSAINISRQTKEEQKQILDKLDGVKKTKNSDINSLIASIKEIQIDREDQKINIDKSTPTLTKQNNIEPMNQSNECVYTLDDINMYLKYGAGSDSDEKEILSIKDCIEELEEYMDGMLNTTRYFKVLKASLEIYNNIYKGKIIDIKQLNTAKDDLYGYIDELNSVLDWMNTIYNNTDIITDIIEEIDNYECEDDWDIYNVDENGFLYNRIGKKVAKIEGESSNFIKYSSFKEEETGDYAYDKDNNKIGKIKWLK